MPLSAKNTATWYADELSLPELRSRREYIAAIRPHRIAHLKEMLWEHQPQVVIFYGRRRSWPGLIGLTFERGDACDHGRLGRTLLLAMNHPTAYGVPRDMFGEVARSIAKNA